MSEENPHSTARIAGHPIHPMLVPFPIACWVGALVTDIVYAKTADMQWANFSAWLITAGVVMAVLAAIAGAVDFFGDRRIRKLRPAWIHVVGNVIALIVAIFNGFVHSRDAYTSVVPTGLILSVIVVLIILVTGWNGWDMVQRHGVGVQSEDRQ
ncbi:MAG TPA: DUF2231 domain-containing protein [Caulobacteraceae bacterium]|jgi:uncharacterized membrane protein|nr:DUF2231 domain-containing protein [Caulobacteraceae bacterium]